MAGIGFELKKIYGRKTLASNIWGTIYATMTTIGPAVLSAILMVILKVMLNYAGLTVIEERFYISATIYIFAIAAVISVLFAAPVSRYISDCIFLEKEQDICPSCFGLLAISTSLAGIVMLVLCYGIAHADYEVTTLFLIAYYVVGILATDAFVMMTYASAMNRYKAITFSFLTGLLIAVFMYLLLHMGLFVEKTTSAFVALAVCYFVIVFTLAFQTVRTFGVPKGKYFQFLTYVKRYPKLTVASIAYTVGIYMPMFINWAISPSGEQISVLRTFIDYDISIYAAIVVNMPALVIFVVKVETAFYEKYTSYVSALNNGTLPMIEREREIMERALHQQLFFVYEIQLIITLVFACFLSVTFPYFGATTYMVNLFMVLSLSIYTVFCMYFTIIVFYYFSDYGGACISAVVFFVVTTVCAVIAALLDEFYALPLLIGGISGWLVSFLLLRHRMKNLDSFLMCK